MTNRIYILYVFLCTSLANAQYMGGSDDGSDWSVLNGSKLNGTIASFSVLYQGSSGDGFDAENDQLILSNSSFNIYNGRNGDGFSQHLIALTLLGNVINDLYQGNSGDGFSIDMQQSILNGQNTTVMFLGNDGDGADNEISIGLLLEGFMSDLFKGGNGDGFASLLKPDNYLTGVMLVLFNGGNGDGFAVNNFTSALTLDVVEQLIQLDILLYPNPASHVVQLKPSDGLIISSVELYDISGKKIDAHLAEDNSMNVSNLSDGVYLLNIFSENRSVTKRLIIKK
ncbi:T9SS type A sorting domain-containing protein [Psychroserpens sp. MEBiC05023]